MLHCLRNESYRKPSAEKSSSAIKLHGLHPLVIDNPKDDNHAGQEVSTSVNSAMTQQLKLEDVRLTITSRINLRLKNCNITTLVRLIKEVEAALC